MKKILFLNKYLLAFIPFMVPLLLIIYLVINNILINIFPITSFLLTPNNIIINNWWYKYELTPVKKFKIDWKIIMKKDYSNILEKNELIINEDWLIAFWKITKPEYLDNLDITQLDRSFVYNYKTNIDITRQYVSSHLINVNILTNNNKIKKTLNELPISSELKIFGYLVNIELIENDSYFKQKTSTILTDSGYWSSKILYVTELEIDWKTIK